MWWFVSDLHLGSGVSDSGGAGRALPQFLEVVLEDPRPDRHLVMLGDTADIDGGHPAAPGRPSAVRQLDEVVERFPDVFDALARCLRAGVTVHVVSGNHDVALDYTAVRDRLRQHLGSPGPAALRFHRWLLYEPGLLYAEHGNQHHPLNRFPLMLRPGAGGGEVPPRTPIAAWATRGLPKALLAARLLAALRATRVAERGADDASYRELVREEGVAAGLPEEAVQPVHDVSRFRAVPAAAFSVVRLVTRGTRLDDRDGYLRRAAARIDNVLTAAGQQPSYYIFGHTHQAALTPMSRDGAYYANCGTWSGLFDGGDREDGDCPYLVVENDGHARHARLERWRSSGVPPAASAAVAS